MFLWLSLTLVGSKVPQPLVEVELTFGQTVTVNATCLFMHPHHNMATWHWSFSVPGSQPSNFLGTQLLSIPKGRKAWTATLIKKGWTRQCLLLIVDVSSLFGPFDWTRLMFFDTHMHRWYWVTLDHIGSMFSGIYGKLTSDWWPGNYTIWPGKFIMESLILWWYDGICPGKFPNLLANFLISWKLS